MFWEITRWIIIALFGLGGLFTIVWYSWNTYQDRVAMKQSIKVSQEVIDNEMKKLSVNAPEPIEKDERAKFFVSKSEKLYAVTSVQINKEKMARNRRIKEVTDSNGSCFITDKAIVVQSLRLSSGKKRFLYKNFTSSVIVPKGTLNSKHKVEMIYSNKPFTVVVNDQELKDLCIAFYLMNNIPKDDI